MLRLGGSLLEGLLALDAGQRGPRVDCGQGHGAAFVGYRAKGLDTVLGPVTLRRAWYHCPACGGGRAPRDAELLRRRRLALAGAARDGGSGGQHGALRARPP